MSELSSVLELRNVVAGYGGSVVLQHVSLEVGDGEAIAICGRNGAGKTTLLRTVDGMTRVHGGDIWIAGCRVTGSRPTKIARLGVALVPEGRCLFPGLSVRENLLLGVFCEGRSGWRGARLGLEKVCGLFPWMEHRLGQAAGLLSGGEQQMVAIARALMANPRMVLLDEPSLGLAPSTAAGVFESLRAVKEEGVALVVVEENMKSLEELVSRVYTMNAGELVLGRSGRLGVTR